MDNLVDLKGVKFKVIGEGGFHSPSDHIIYMNVYQTTPQLLVDFLTDIAEGEQKEKNLLDCFFRIFYAA